MNDVITNSVLLFFSSYSVVLLLGFQSQVVRLGHKGTSFILSTFIGGMQIFAYKLVPNAGSIESGLFILGGALGIVSSIVVHEWYVKYHGIIDTRGVLTKEN